jgi:hypothetical protein
MSPDPKPTVGRIVHYYEQFHIDDPVHGPFAAIIVEVPTHPSGSWVVVRIFKPHGREIDAAGGHYDESDPPKGRTWRWPPRA